MKVVYMFVTYILWGSVCYTAANIPYGSMASVITADPGERTSLSTFRSIGAMFAAIPIMVISPLILFRTTETGAQVVIPERFLLAAVIFGILAMVAYILCYQPVSYTHLDVYKRQEVDVVNGPAHIFGVVGQRMAAHHPAVIGGHLPLDLGDLAEGGGLLDAHGPFAADLVDVKRMHLGRLQRFAKQGVCLLYTSRCV